MTVPYTMQRRMIEQLMINNLGKNVEQQSGHKLRYYTHSLFTWRGCKNHEKLQLE